MLQLPQAPVQYESLPEAPGLGIEVDTAALKKYLVQAEITVGGKTLYRTPSLD